MRDFLYHLWNDPVNSNPWSFAALLVIVGATLAGLVALEAVRQMFRRRKQETKMADEQEQPQTQIPTPLISDAEFDEKWTNLGQPPKALVTPDGERVDLNKVRAEREPVEDYYFTHPYTPASEADTEVREAVPADDGGHPSPRERFATPGIASTMLPQQVSAPPVPSRHFIEGAPVRASATIPKMLVTPHRETCPTCRGTGHMPSISDHLRESIGLVGNGGDEIIRAFYGELLSVAPDLAALFPADLLTAAANSDTKGSGQRDKLLKALVALSEMYDPASEEKMARLDTALRAFGRSHAAFVRPDGTIQGATWEEYAAVKGILFATLIAAAGPQWIPEYTAAWSQAYDYAAAVMLAEQYRSGFSAPRFPAA